MLYVKQRIRYVILCSVTIVLGLFSRSSYIPQLIYPYIGDVLYATMMFWVFACFYPNKISSKLLYYSIGLCFIIECSQLYQAEWINEIRYTKLGGLILGFGFLWTDLICYTIGGLLAYKIDVYIKKEYYHPLAHEL